MIGNRIGPYQVIRLIAEDRFGQIFEALDQASKKRVAIRALRLGPAGMSDTATRLYSEAKTLARLHHPHVARTYGFIRNSNGFFLVLELVEGETLQSVLEAKHRLEPPIALAYFRQILSAVSFAHSLGVVHGDLKAANIVVTNFGQVKILDFALALLLRENARQAGEHEIPPSNTPVGNAAPAPDEEADIFSLGALMYECLAGRKPAIPGEPAARSGAVPLALSLELNECPEWLNVFVRRALQPHSAEGFPTVTAMAEAMDAAVTGDTRAHPRARAWARRLGVGRPVRITGLRRTRAAGSLLSGATPVGEIRRCAAAWRRFCGSRKLDRTGKKSLRSFAGQGSALMRRAGQHVSASFAAQKKGYLDPWRGRAINVDVVARLRAAAGALPMKLPPGIFPSGYRGRLSATRALFLSKTGFGLRSCLDAMAGSDWRRYAAITIVATSALIEIFVFRGTNTLLMFDGRNATAMTQHGAAESFIELVAHRPERAAPAVARAENAAPTISRRSPNSSAETRAPARPSPTRDPEHHRARVARRVVTYRVPPSEVRSPKSNPSEPAPARSSGPSKVQLNVKWEN